MSRLHKLFILQCEDLKVLAEMEWNGILMDVEASRKKANELELQAIEIEKKFADIVGDKRISLSSGPHLSAYLYGGSIVVEDRVPDGVFKTGKRAGQIKYKIEKKEKVFPRLVEPPKDQFTAASAKRISEGYAQEHTQWSVKEDILKELKANKETRNTINMILEYRGLGKLVSTYLNGWPDLIEENCWEGNIVHGSLNQCVAETGRLSSTKPNLQNANKTVKQVLITRYDK